MSEIGSDDVVKLLRKVIGATKRGQLVAFAVVVERKGHSKVTTIGGTADLLELCSSVRDIATRGTKRFLMPSASKVQ